MQEGVATHFHFGLVLQGESQTFPPGTTRDQGLPLGTTDLGGDIRVRVVVDSPEGDPVVVDTSDRAEVTATPVGIALASATVAVAGRILGQAPGAPANPLGSGRPRARGQLALEI